MANTLKYSYNPYSKAYMQMSSKLIKQHLVLHETSHGLIQSAIEKPGLSTRANDSILKVSRTIADL